MYKALITDLDGSAVALSSDGRDVDVPTRKAVKAAQEAGAIISCATGRGWLLAKPVVESLGIKSLCVVGGGTTIIDPVTEEAQWQKFLDGGVANHVLDIFKQMVRRDTTISIDGSRRQLGDISDVQGRTSYLYLLGLEQSVAQKIISRVNIDLKGHAIAHTTISWSGSHLIDIHVTHTQATKEHAVSVWHKLEGVSKKETIAMGDSGNDIPLFNAAGFKIATDNATPELKALADYIAPAATDHALRHVIEKFLL